MIESFVEYITRSFGIPLRIQAVGHPEKLPLYLKSGFEFFKGELGGKMLAWAKITHPEDLTPRTLHNQKDRLEQFFLIPVVFVIDRMDSWQRKRLIEKHIAFVETGKQMKNKKPVAIF